MIIMRDRQIEQFYEAELNVSVVALMSTCRQLWSPLDTSKYKAEILNTYNAFFSSYFLCIIEYSSYPGDVSSYFRTLSPCNYYRTQIPAQLYTTGSCEFGFYTCTKGLLSILLLFSW